MPKNILSKSELDDLANAITEAEKKTSGEMRLMIVKRSAHAGYVLPAVFLVLVSLSLLAAWYLRQLPGLEAGLILLDDPWWFIPAVLVMCALVALGLSRVEAIQRVFIPPLDQHRAVMTRAELEFYREGLNHTKGATGILLFLSLFEHEAVVLADRSIASKLKPDTWDEVVALILEGPKTGHWKTKLEEAIQKCGALLAQHFPVQPGDTNELANHVILKD